MSQQSRERPTSVERDADTSADERSDRAERDRLLEAIGTAPTGRLRTALARRVRSLTAASLVDLIEACPVQVRHAVWRSAHPRERGESLIAVGGDVRGELIDEADTEELLASLAHLQMDELADLEDQLPEAVLHGLIESMSSADRSRFETLRRFPAESAGGLMDVDALAVRAHLSLGEVQDRLRDVREREGSLPEHVDSVFAVDEQGCYVGRLLLADVISMPPQTPVGAALKRDLEPLDASLPAEAVARRFEDQDLISAPVIDADGHLLGRITIDDVVDVIRGEGENAVLGMAGLDRDVDPFGSLTSAVQRRLIWIGVHLVNGLVAALVVGLYRESIEALVALAVLMPIVAGVGGVGGTQSLALVMRGVALEQIRPANAPRLLAREVAIALINGASWALVIATIVYVWFDDLGLALVFAAGMIFNLVNGAFFGTWLPLVLPKIGVDPAVAGGVILVAATDVLGFLIFLSLASAVLL